MEDVTGVSVGGGIAIVTTVANLAYNWLQNRSERQFAMRQQVYLDACTWAASGTQYLASFARLDLDDAQLSQVLLSANAAYYRVHVVAEQRTVRAFTAAAEYLGTQSVQLTRLRLQLRQLALRLEDRQMEAEQTSSYLAQAASVVENVPKNSPSPESLASVPALVSEFSSDRDRQRLAHAEIASIQLEIDQRQAQLLGESLRAAVGYETHLIAANISARRELGFELSEDDYRDSVGTASKRVSADLERMIEELKPSE